jgi:endonuclease/exonuclease/phosphatase family metal-dependent hydrolase
VPGGRDARILRVTTFNLLHDQIRNFSARWPVRRPAAMRMIRALSPDILCLQEVSGGQLADLATDLAEYELVAGVATGPVRHAAWFPAALGRAWLGDFFASGEYCPILLRRETVVRMSDGCDLEPLPAPLRSVATPHVVTWASFRMVANGLAASIHNTHLSILPWRTLAGARRLRERLDAAWTGELQLAAGDFNTRSNGPALQLLRSPSAHAPGFHDLWREAREQIGAAGTHDLPGGFPGPRIDYVLARPGRTALRAEVTVPGTGVRPSDHRPVTIDLATDQAGPPATKSLRRS